MPLLTTQAGVFPAPVVVAGNTWNTSTATAVGGAMTFTDSNRTVTQNSTTQWNAVRSTVSMTGLKKYVELSITTSAVVADFGVCTAACGFPPSAVPGLSDGEAIVMYRDGGIRYFGNAPGGGAFTTAPPGGCAWDTHCPQTIRMCIDDNLKLIWFTTDITGDTHWNDPDGSSGKNPAAGTGGYNYTGQVNSGALYLVIGLNDANATGKLRTVAGGAHGYLATPPSGFGDWV